MHRCSVLEVVSTAVLVMLQYQDSVVKSFLCPSIHVVRCQSINTEDTISH